MYLETQFRQAANEDDNAWRRILQTPHKGSFPAVRGGPAPRKSKSPKRVLIVEDDLDAARSMYMLLEDMGHVANYAINGYVAFDVAKAFQPQIVLLDLGLPGPNGFDVCERMKADPDLKHARVIVITGYANDEFRIRSQKVGCELHLIKPVPASVIEHILG